MTPNGSKLWRFRYRFGGKQLMISFGAFPEVSLATAREKRDDARKLIANGKDPSQQKKLDKIVAATAANNTFGAIAEEHLAALKENGAAEATLNKVRWLLLDLASPLTKRPIAEITPAEILLILKRWRKADAETPREGFAASSARSFVSPSRRSAPPTDPTYALQGALLAPVVHHRPAITDEKQLGALMASIDEYDGWPTLKSALLFLALTMARPGEVRYLRRNEIIWPKATWRIPPERMKMRRPHDVPLSRQALAVLRDIWDAVGRRCARISLDPFHRANPFGKRHEFGAATDGLHQGRNVRPWLPLIGEHDPQ